ncbi:tRNA (adenosine(37)-N6)-dimethylallyltransferase MiaA [Candidatus Parcubacteria bacterium]|nr:tRNA (adenosine(37)-N6)-dimethylallyltransferase MiaA [Candidatus Parcubacteria bacterium]
MKKVLVIVGPTASGKSDLAVKLARKLGGEIISADSRQVYKGLDIGTGKITRAEMKGVPHHMLDVADPRKQFSASQFKKMAQEELGYIEKRGKLPIIVGGTGFYIDALTGATHLPEVPPNKKLREKLGTKTNAALFKILERKDPKCAKRIDANNKVRLIRALEIVKALGKVPVLKNETSNKFIYIGLNPKDLKGRIERRVRKMFKSGLSNEVRKLKRLGITNKRFKQLGFEYFNPTPESVTRGTNNYAKRQMTWFKRNRKITWYASASAAYEATARLLGGAKRPRSRR